MKFEQFAILLHCNHGHAGGHAGGTAAIAAVAGWHSLQTPSESVRQSLRLLALALTATE